MINREKFDEQFIVMRTSQYSISCCRRLILGSFCFCGKVVYRIKPYVKKFMMATRVFFETICYSELPLDETSQVVKHLENQMYKHIGGIAEQFIARMNRPYFNMIVSSHNIQCYLPCTNDTVLNIHALTMNREPSRIFMVSSNPINLCLALIAGVCIVPVPRN